MNNIFKYATGELSQDAFICWFFNWFNEGDNQKLKKAVTDFCRDKFSISPLSSVDIYRQFSRKVEKDKISFPVKIDVLLILNNDTAVIIEDKTFSSEHSNQILRYADGLKTLQEKDEERKLRIEGRSYSISKIISVYWKTGFFYNRDKRIESDVTIKSDDLIDLLGEYRNENQIIDMYIQNLLDGKLWYEIHEKYWDRATKTEEEGDWNTNLCKHQIAQYTMMREIFPEREMWRGGNLYYVEHGSSYGRPWTEMWVYSNRRSGDSEGDKRFEIFWRIDTDNKGSYISLRLYKFLKGKWDSKYDDIKHHVMDYIINESSYSWKEIDPGKRDSYKEADIAHFKINKKEWENNGEYLKSVIRALTQDIVDFAQEKYGPNVYE